MKIMILGGTGMLGKSLAKLLSKNHAVCAIGTEMCNLVRPGRYEFDIQDCISFEKPDYVIHAAALVGGIEDNIARCSDYLYENSIMNLQVVEACRKNKVPHLLSMLSTCVYPDSSEELTEDMLHDGLPHETNFGYAYSKRLMAKHIDLTNKQYGTNYSYIIPCNLYGQNDHRDGRAHFVSKLIDRVIAAKRDKLDKLVFYGFSTPVRQYLHVDDLARVILGHVNRKITDCYNVAYDVPLSIADMVKMVCENADYTGEIEFLNQIPGQGYRVASLAKFHEVHPNFKFTSFTDGTKKVYDAWASS